MRDGERESKIGWILKKLDGTPKLINVSNRLPVTVTEEGIRRSSGGLVAALEGLGGEGGVVEGGEAGHSWRGGHGRGAGVTSGDGIIRPAEAGAAAPVSGEGAGEGRGGYTMEWIGWPGGEIEGGRQSEVRKELEGRYGYVPVFMTREEEEGFYGGFANGSLWPLLHYMPTYMRYEEGWWEAYEAVNRRYAEAVVSRAREGDLVWVHDYQLMLVPGMVKERMPGVRVGFFLHTPFPSYEVFRCHPKRAELLKGMLGADLIGFHTFGYMRHFRSAVLRLLGVESEMARIRYGGRAASLGIFPIGINARRFEEEMAGAAYRERRAELARNYAERRVVLSVERLDYTKGIPRRLRAIELYLKGCSDEERERIKFVFVSVPSRENVAAYRELREETERRVGRINGTYATLHNSPIHFMHGSVSFTELCALYSVAEVAMVTPLVDGMNLVAKEYVAAQAEEPGVLILSEFAGAAEELWDAVVVNPYDPPAVAGAIREALAMPVEERRRRMEGMRGRVMRQDARRWAEGFIRELGRQPAGGAERRGGIEEVRERLGAAVREGKRVGLFLDYDGTLREIVTDPGAAVPSSELRRLLRRMAELPNVDVTVVSGRRPGDLERWLGNGAVGLVAEHGAEVRRAGSMEWERLDRNVSYRWKAEVLKLLRGYEDSTPGSFIEDKRTGLVWHYRKADAEFGEWKARQLANELGTVTADEPVQVRHGKKIVEVAASEVNKGAAVRRLSEGRGYEVIVCAGDDVTDESMFRMGMREAITIKVGEGETAARYRVGSPGELRALLAEVVGEGREVSAVGPGGEGEGG